MSQHIYDKHERWEKEKGRFPMWVQEYAQMLRRDYDRLFGRTQTILTKDISDSEMLINIGDSEIPVPRHCTIYCLDKREKGEMRRRAFSLIYDGDKVLLTIFSERTMKVLPNASNSVKIAIDL